MVSTEPSRLSHDLLLTVGIGRDLAGNTFWEFKETANATRLRRIVKYSKQVHYADVKLSRESPNVACMTFFSDSLPSGVGTMAPTYSATCAIGPRAKNGRNETGKH